MVTSFNCSAVSEIPSVDANCSCTVADISSVEAAALSEISDIDSIILTTSSLSVLIFLILK